MKKFEYKVVPAPKKGKRLKGLRGAEARFAHALEQLMNELGGEGWVYIRADTLPVEERQGLTGRATVFQNMLVFRRPLAQAAAEPADAAAAFPGAGMDEPDNIPQAPSEPPAALPETAPEAEPAKGDLAAE